MIGHLHNSIDNLLKGCVTTQVHVINSCFIVIIIIIMTGS